MQNDLCPGGEGSPYILLALPPQLPGQDVVRSVVGLVYPVDWLESCGWNVFSGCQMAG